ATTAITATNLRANFRVLRIADLLRGSFEVVVLHLRQAVIIDEMVGMIGGVALQANLGRNGAPDIAGRGGRGVLRPGAVADLALHVGQGLARRSEAVAVGRPVADDVAGDALRLEVAVPIEERLQRGGVP